MKTLILNLILIVSAFASIAEYSAKSQPPDGSFYLEGDRQHFRHPAKLADMADMIYLESENEAGYKNNNYLMAVTEKQLVGALMLDELIGIEGYFSALNGEGVKSYGLTLGTSMSGYNFSFGFVDGDGMDFTPKMNFSLDAYDGTIFGEYLGQIVSVPTYEFTVGYGKVIEDFFGDITYNQKDDLKYLSATIGGKKWILERLAGVASAKKEVFFTGQTKVSAGLVWYPTNKIELGASHSLTAFSKDKPNFSDFDLILSASYRI
jgi:hypothetical protein